VEIDFKNLIRLQKLDEEIKETSFLIENIPLKINGINKEFTAIKEIVQQTKDKLSENQKKRRSLESEAQDLKVQIDKYKQQLNNARSNLEYKSLMKEIEHTEEKISTIEDEIINEMVLADDISEEIKAAEHKEIKEAEILLKKKESLESEKTTLEGKRDKLLEEKEKLKPGIPSAQTSLYERIFGKKNGIALSPVTDDFCSMCQIRIRPQVLNELKEKKEIILCENCGRILYWSGR
jgi:predicted  nucleic acid-binding Zn-ribbon protein